MALFHEDLRCEQLVTMAQTLGLPLRLALPVGCRRATAAAGARGALAAGLRPAASSSTREVGARVDVPEFEIDAQPVNWGQFVEFVDDGGYDRAEFWLPQGWQWLQREADGGPARAAPRRADRRRPAAPCMQMLFGKSPRACPAARARCT